MSNRVRPIWLILVVLLAFQLPALATVINVPGDFEQIDTAIRNSDDGDTIRVARGEYDGNINYRGRDIVLASDFLFTGDEADINATILNGHNNSAVVFINQRESNVAQLVGFTVSGGRAGYGGALFIQRADPQIRYCKFTGNEANNNGGAVKVYRANPTFDNCEFTQNTAGNYGGALFVDRGLTIVRNCLFEENHADGDGGAIKIYEGEVRVSYSDFIGNTATNGGGAVRGCERETQSSFDHCTFIRNEAGNSGGGGLLFIDRGNHEINFCTIFGNTANDAMKSAIYAVGQAEVELKNSIVWGNGNGQGNSNTIFGDLEIEYSDIESDQAYDEDGNITDNPNFADSDNNDVHLTEGSSCIDTADPEADYDPDNTRADMGAYWQQHQGGGGGHEIPQGGTIQEAIDNAEDGDTVYVDQGTYEENINLNGRNIILCSRWVQTNDDEDIANTIITGADGSPVITFNNGETADCKVLGLTIRNAHAGNHHGGGMYIEDASPTVEHCVFEDIELENDYYGGGVYGTGSHSNFRYCTFKGNHAGKGGGVHSVSSEMNFYNCKAYENDAIEGGGFVSDESTINLRYCQVYNNTSPRGAGLWCNQSDVRVTNCTFGRNRAYDGQDDGFGGGVYINNACDMYLLNNIFYSNSPEEFYCNIDGEGSNFIASWNDIEGGINGIGNRRACNIDRWLVSNFDEDPLFVDGDNFDFHITEDSPCVDGGDPASDPDPDGTKVDVGALYFERDNIYVLEFWGGGWWQIAMSVLPFDNRKVEVFWDDLTRSYDVYDFEYDRGFRAVETVEPGPGYWFGTEDTTIYLDVIGAELDDTVRTDLQVPWNLVGTPFLEEIELDNCLFRRDGRTIYGFEAIEEGWISPIMYNWRHEWFEYRTFDTFYPWWGYWLLAMVDDIQLIIPPPSDDQAPAPPRRDAIDDAGLADAWYLNVDFAVGETAQTRLRLGANMEANDGFDNFFDYPEPVAPPDGWEVRAYFLHQGWHPEVGDYYHRDIRAPFEFEQVKEWSATIEAEAGEEVTVYWETLPFTIPDDFTFILVDETTNEQIDMLAQDNYSFVSDGSRNFVFRTQSLSHADGSLREAIPESFEISSVYPNPFNSTTKLNFTMPNAGVVKASVFDITGRNVAMLMNDYRSAGSHSVEWEADNVSAGVYFVNLELDGARTCRKIVLMK